MSGGNAFWRRPLDVLVPVAGLLYVGVLVLYISTFESPPTSASNPYPLIADGFAGIDLIAAFLIWRGNRIGYPVGLIMSVLFLLLFTGDLQDGLTGFVDLSIFLQTVTLFPVLLLILVYSILGVLRAWRKGAPPKSLGTVSASTTLAVLTVGFIVGAAFIGILASGVESRLLATSGTGADITIVPGASMNSGSGPFFSPENFTVKAGSAVTWINKDTVTHTVTSKTSGIFDSGNMPTGATFRFTFTTAGTYAYYCTIHPFMTGTVIVTLS